MRIARLALPLAAVVLLATAAACSDPQDEQPRAFPDSSAAAQDTTFNADLLQILRRRQQRFGVFTTLLDSAGLARPLQSGGPYTVFAATSSGLDRLPEGAVEELLLPQNRDRLTSILGYHIHRGKLSKKDVRAADSISTLTQRWLPVTVEGGRVMIGEATISEYSLTGRNGRIYAIDALVLPPLGSSPVDLPADTSVLDRPGDGDDDASDGGDASSDGAGT